ncbi:MAG: hypothetical protein ACREN1_01765 [Candidatus Dormibacteria bacterium]
MTEAPWSRTAAWTMPSAVSRLATIAWDETPGKLIRVHVNPPSWVDHNSGSNAHPSRLLANRIPDTPETLPEDCACMKDVGGGVMLTQLFPPSCVRNSARHSGDVPHGTAPNTQPCRVDTNVTDATERSLASASEGNVHATDELGVDVFCGVTAGLGVAGTAADCVALGETTVGVESQPTKSQPLVTATNPTPTTFTATLRTTLRPPPP